MRCHVLSDSNGLVLALEIAATREHGGTTRFVCKTPQQICYDVEMAPELFRQLRADGRQTVPRLRVVETDGQARLVA